MLNAMGPVVGCVGRWVLLWAVLVCGSCCCPCCAIVDLLVSVVVAVGVVGDGLGGLTVQQKIKLFFVRCCCC